MQPSIDEIDGFAHSLLVFKALPYGFTLFVQFCIELAPD
jgi:hypothetical protein